MVIDRLLNVMILQQGKDMFSFWGGLIFPSLTVRQGRFFVPTLKKPKFLVVPSFVKNSLKHVFFWAYS